MASQERNAAKAWSNKSTNGGIKTMPNVALSFVTHDSGSNARQQCYISGHERRDPVCSVHPRGTQTSTQHGQSSMGINRQQINKSQWRQRISSEQAAHNRERRRVQEQFRVHNMTQTQNNARIERRRIAQRLTRSILPPTHMGSLHLELVAQRSRQHRDKLLAGRRILGSPTIDQTSASTHADLELSTNSQYLEHQTVGTITRVTEQKGPPHFRQFEQGFSSNNANTSQSNILEGIMSDDELIQVLEAKVEDEFLCQQRIAKNNNKVENRVRKSLLITPGWYIGIEVDNYILNKLIVKELISQLEPSDDPVYKKYHKKKGK